MPRDGSGIYTKPFPDVAPATTIESAVYNGFVNDVATDLNAPRPIVAGGTGANSATDALFNLKAEMAAYAVTNFDTHVWYPGSFRSTAAATAPPVPGHAFAGTVYINEPLANPPTNANVVVVARDLDDTDTPGAVWVREKKANVWGAWAVEGSGALNGKVSKAGDTMTGLLILSGDAVAALGAATKQQVDARVAKAGDTMTGALVLPGDAVAALQAVPKQQLDATALSVATTVATDITKARRNYAMNPTFWIAQEFAGAVQSINGMYACDGYKTNFNLGTMSAQRSINATPGGAAHRLRLVVTAAAVAMGTTGYIGIQAPIEGVDVLELQYGTAAAKTITISFGVLAPAGTYGVSLWNAALNRFYCTSFTITGPEANTAVRKSVTVPGDVTGTWDKAFGAGLTWSITLGAGTNFIGAQNAWSATQVHAPAGQFNWMGTGGNVFELFDVMVNEGTTAQAFYIPEFIPMLQRCQRQFAKTFGIDIALAQNSGNFNGVLIAGTDTYSTGEAVTFDWRFPVTMRAVPTMGVYTPGAFGGAGVASDRFGGANTITAGAAVASTDGATWASATGAGVVMTPCIHALALARL